MRIALAVAILLTLAPLGRGQESSEFIESFDALPLRWTLSGEGSADEPGKDGGKAICVRGSGDDSSSWHCEDLELEPRQLYRLSFWLRGSSTGGCAIAGTTSNNRDFQAEADWNFESFVFRTPEDTSDVRLRVGQWHCEGTVWFDELKLEPVIAVDRLEGALVLGLGEQLQGHRYTFESRFEDEGTNYSPRLLEARAGFNSHRLTFSQGDSVTYRYELGGRTLQKGRVHVNLGYFVSGQCLVEAKADGGKWTRVGTLRALGSESFAIPEGLLPSKELLVRFRADSAPDSEHESRPGSFQIYSHSFEAEVDGDELELVGETQFPSIRFQASSFDVRILSLGTLRPGRNNEVVLEIETKESDLELVGRLLLVSSDSYVLSSSDRPVVGNRVALPFEVTRVGRTTMMIGVSTAEDDGEKFVATLEFEVPSLYDANYGKALFSHADWDLWWCEATFKVSRERRQPKVRSAAIELQAARGEYEPVQLVIRPRLTLEEVRLEAGDLIGPGGAIIPASAVELLQVRYVEVTRPTDTVGGLGWWPDPLPPLDGPLTLEANRNQPIWIRVRVPEDAAAGDYQGTLRFSAKGSSEEISLKLHVFDFSLPRETSVKSAFGLDRGAIRDFHRLEDAEQLREVLEKYYRNFAAHRVSPYDPMTLDPPRVKLEDSPGGEQVTIDWTGFDRAAELYLDGLGFSAFRLHLSGMGSGTYHSRRPGKIGSHEIGTPEYERLFGEYVRQVEAHLAERGWLDEAYLYWFDEPEPKDYAFVREGMEAVHRHAPGIRRMLTEQPEEELFGAVDLWCPVLHGYEEESAKQRQELGEEIWWYVCTGPKGDWTTLFLDHPAVNMRMWLWQTWKYGVDGILVWTTNHWTSHCAFPPPARQDPYADPMAYVQGYDRPAGYVGYWGNGDGRFVYPPEACVDPDRHGPVLEGPVDSFRWEMLREGIEDYEYFHLLEELVEKAIAEGRGGEPEVQRAGQLLVVPELICGSRTEFARDPRHLYVHRTRLARAIEQLTAR